MESSLACLPNEILDLILSRPSHSYLAIHLWLTGDSRLISKLSSGLTCLYLSANSEVSSFLPQILGSLHALRTLKLTSSENSLVRTHQDWRPLISSLPKTLKVLSIDSRDSIFAVRNLATDLNSPTKYITTVYKRGPSNFIDLGTLFPQLETLVLKGYRLRGFPKNNSHGGNEDDEDHIHDLENYAGVPDTVTHLGLPYVLLGKLAKLAPLMPPSLIFLESNVVYDYTDLSIEEIQQDWDLPHLERITSLTWIDQQPKNVSWLPRSLKQCSIEKLDPLTLAIAQTLPPDLESLKIFSFDRESFAKCESPSLSALPKHLTSLELSCPIPSRIADLPRMLTRLRVNDKLDLLAEQETKRNQGLRATHENLDWPPSLTSLSAFIHEIDKGILCLLPHTLTDLNIFSPFRGGPIELDGRELPPGLRTLRASFSTNVIISGALPTTLTHFTTKIWSVQHTVSFASSTILPPSLTFLDTRLSFPKDESGHLVTPTTIVLPPNLETLITHEFHVDWFSKLPRSLRHLDIYAVHGTLKIPSNKVSTLFSGLPALETINLNRFLNFTGQEPGCGAVPSESLGSLPLSLKSVSIPTYDVIKLPTAP